MMIGIPAVPMGVIRARAVMVRMTGFDYETAFQLVSGFVEQLHHAFSRRLVEDGGYRLQILDAALDQSKHVFGRRTVERASIPALDVYR